MQKGNAAYIKTINKKLILQCIKEGKAITRADISKRLSLSKPTVSTLVNQLLEDDLIYESGNGQAANVGGRKPVNLMFNSKQSYIIGIDIGGTNVRSGITDLNGDVCAYRNFPTQQHLGKNLFKEIKRSAESMKDQLKIDDKKILGVGVGTPGVTNVAEGIVLEAPALRWKHFPIKERLKEIFDLPIEVDNDVNISVLGEHWKGIGKDKSNLIYIAIGTGIGSGIMINGSLYRGSNYSAGEIGYLVTNRVHAKDFHPVYEGYGFLESISSGSSIGKQLSDKIGKDVTAKEAFAFYKQNHKDAIEVINLALENLAIGLANYVSLFDPELIILGGGVSGSFSIIQEQVIDIMKRYTPRTCEVQQTTFGKEAGIVGAAALFLKEHDTLFNI
ncbi:ROK family protein [Virgibacillus dakarensis]|uniref:ROK family transcriptional regulator n=1 Tax=Virgibacillus dakarensis TaxID=1917889 RepID=UPI000B43153B|nr:ROK family transcriptional regulator [Virgibacillus dakarensis]MBT2217569.1 ROK family transcriptional regulator [Virgibacillus dakarensis]MTW88246.1 ROK family protein [Virgibacillus dakarensis]